MFCGGRREPACSRGKTGLKHLLVPLKIRGPHREWVLQQIEAGGDVTLQGLADGLTERGLKVDYRTMSNFVHRKGKCFKRSRVWG